MGSKVGFWRPSPLDSPHFHDERGRSCADRLFISHKSSQQIWGASILVDIPDAESDSVDRDVAIQEKTSGFFAAPLNRFRDTQRYRILVTRLQYFPGLELAVPLIPDTPRKRIPPAVQGHLHILNRRTCSSRMVGPSGPSVSPPTFATCQSHTGC